jgi:hypothetical protein
MRQTRNVLSVVILAGALAACGSSSKSPASPSTPTTPVAPTLTKPLADSPADGDQLDNLRPTLIVVNGTSNQSTAKTYEFQISDNSTFAASTGGSVWFASTASSGQVPEDPGGKTKYTPTQDLQPTTKYYWRARLVQSGTNSDWSDVRTFKTKLVGYNKPGELYDPLLFGETVGTISGSKNATWVPGKGLTLNDLKAYVIYELPQVLSSGEFSMEVTGLHTNGPGGKPKIFQLVDQITSIPSSAANYINAQYRGSPGNPDNCVAFKAVLGDGTSGSVVEPDLGKRQQSVVSTDPGRVYLWKGIWTPNSFRLVVKDGGETGATVYDYQMTAPTGHWNPSRLYAFVGSNYEQYMSGTGTFPGITVRNVWLSATPRPTTLGSAMAPLR